MDLAQAQKLAQAGRFAEAEAICRPFLDAHRDDPRAWNLMGSIELGAGRVGDALESMQRAAVPIA
jgi:predicted Zn-dependent protease